MKKKTYSAPTAQVVKVNTQSYLLINSAKTQGLDDAPLVYDDEGGDQSIAW